jgi:tRNA(Ile2) C34 agmatinyltransferase TiaS
MAENQQGVDDTGMGQVFVTCKKCGTKFSTRQFVEREAFNDRKLEPNSYQCPECDTKAEYAVSDYEYSD